MNQRQLNRALQQLALQDADVAAGLNLAGKPAPRQRPGGFETFLSTLVSQQISTSAAQAILGRVHALMPQVTADALLALDPESLRGAGMSYRKIEYAKGLAEAIVDNSFAVDQLPDMDDAEAVAAISSLRGFGRWSAEIYLMFSLDRRDIFPADDLALLVALQRLKNLEQRPTPSQARTLTADWSPWRSAGSLFLWHYYREAPA